MENNFLNLENPLRIKQTFSKCNCISITDPGPVSLSVCSSPTSSNVKIFDLSMILIISDYSSNILAAKHRLLFSGGNFQKHMLRPHDCGGEIVKKRKKFFFFITLKELQMMFSVSDK